MLQSFNFLEFPPHPSLSPEHLWSPISHKAQHLVEWSFRPHLKKFDYLLFYPCSGPAVWCSWTYVPDFNLSRRTPCCGFWVTFLSSLNSGTTMLCLLLSGYPVPPPSNAWLFLRFCFACLRLLCPFHKTGESFSLTSLLLEGPAFWYAGAELSFGASFQPLSLLRAYYIATYNALLFHTSPFFLFLIALYQNNTNPPS